jgi:hypothetical protein
LFFVFLCLSIVEENGYGSKCVEWGLEQATTTTNSKRLNETNETNGTNGTRELAKGERQ